MQDENIPDYRLRELTGIRVSCDERLEVGEPIHQSLHLHLIQANIEWPERVHGANSRSHDFVMMVEDDGHQKRFAWNSRAHFLSGYPIDAPIVGDALFFSEDWGPEGMDFQNIKQSAIDWIGDPARADEYARWLSDNSDYAHEYRMNYPPKK
jgi:hypothetical protein